LPLGSGLFFLASAIASSSVIEEQPPAPISAAMAFARALYDGGTQSGTTLVSLFVVALSFRTYRS
jgi:hypothetical protein